MPRLIVLAALAMPACTFLYNPDNLPEATDARAIDAVPIDADPSQLTLTGITPSTIDEGTGADDGRPALLLLAGASLVGTATVTVTIEGVAEPIAIPAGDVAVSADGTLAGVAVRIPVIADLRDGDPRTLTVTVTQGATSKSITGTVTGLDELILTGTTDAAGLRPRYAQITVAGDAHLTGTTAARLVATGGMTLTGVLDVDASGTSPGPGGCGGGPPATAAPCSPGGGEAGAPNAILGGVGGGGGGSFGTVGTPGANNSTGQGAPGQASGDPSLVPLAAQANRGAGGGGGANPTIGSGGSGGAGGGTILISTGGALIVGADGGIRARGGDGTAPSGSGGGGGSGGAILIRPGAAITVGRAWATAPGGLGGSASSGDGGDGGLGRIRIDTARADARTIGGPDTYAGPSWLPATPVLVATQPTLTVRGTGSLSMAVNAGAPTTITIGAAGTAQFSPQLTPGANQVCASIGTGGEAESLACVDLFYTGG
ncbi:MAG: hypothetical protein R3B06_24805 [Kofleriaceae bacterium]